MSPIIRIESFPEENRPQIAGLITRYTGNAVDGLLTELPVQIDLEGDSFEPLKNQLKDLLHEYVETYDLLIAT